MIAGLNKSKTFPKHISRKCKCRFDGRKCNSTQKWNDNKGRCECENLKEHHVCKKDYIWNPDTCSCKNGKYLACIVDKSVITWDEIVNTTKTVPTKIVPVNFDEKKVTCKTKILYISSSIDSC